jgi:hypothetical protein
MNKEINMYNNTTRREGQRGTERLTWLWLWELLLSLLASMEKLNELASQCKHLLILLYTRYK